MKLLAIKRREQRSGLTSAQAAQSLTRKTARQNLARQERQVRVQNRRYIRLTSPVPELPEFIDPGKNKRCPVFFVLFCRGS
jgi:hypothetical protein